MSYLVLGAGLMGQALVHDLLENSEEGPVTVADKDGTRLEALRERYGQRDLETVQLDVSDTEATSSLVRDHDVLINATSYELNVGLTNISIENDCNMLDLGGNMTVVEEQLSMDARARDAGVLVLPNCGLAPGMANVLGTWMMDGLDETRVLKIYVGGLPLEPEPPLKYLLLFSVKGLINEYVEQVDALSDGEHVVLDPLTGIEEVRFPEPFGALEAFNTSGGISTMVREYEGRVETMYYKTLRYPGHCQIFKALLDVGMMSDGPMEMEEVIISPRAVLEALLSEKLPREGTDATLMHIRVEGGREGRNISKSLWMMDRADEQRGISSMMRTTAFPTSIIAQMIADRTIDGTGVHTPEAVVPGDPFVKALSRRGITFEIEGDLKL